MIQEPLQDKSHRNAVSEPLTILAPTKGLYTGANIADAPPGTAIFLTNAYPELNYVRVRGGSTQYAQCVGQSTVVGTLLPYSSGTGASLNKLFAACNTSIYDVSNAGTSPAAVVTGLGSPYVQYTQFTNTGATWLICVDGVQQVAAALFNGTAWVSTPAITGITGSGGLTNVWSYKERLYFSQANSLNVWYLGLDAIGGAATVFPMAGVFSKGGQIVAGGNYTVTTTNGSYDAWVVISDQGEICVYSGLYPGDASWTKTGIHKVGKPMGRRCLMPAGADLAILMEDGILPLSKSLQLDETALQQGSVTQPIGPNWRDAVTSRGGAANALSQPWQFQLWPLRGMGLSLIHI